MSQSQVIKHWWQNKQEQLQLLFDVMASGGTIHDNEVLYALRYLENHLDRIRRVNYPREVSVMRDALLEMMDNIYQSLKYRLSDQAYNAEVRIERALASLDMLRFHLLQEGIIL